MHHVDHLLESDSQVSDGDVHFQMVIAVFLESHTGMDQGENNFGIVMVQKKLSSSSKTEYPIIVAAENYTDLSLWKKIQINQHSSCTPDQN